MSVRSYYFAGVYIHTHTKYSYSIPDRKHYRLASVNFPFPFGVKSVIIVCRSVPLSQTLNNYIHRVLL